MLFNLRYIREGKGGRWHLIIFFKLLSWTRVKCFLGLKGFVLFQLFKLHSSNLVYSSSSLFFLCRSYIHDISYSRAKLVVHTM